MIIFETSFNSRPRTRATGRSIGASERSFTFQLTPAYAGDLERWARRVKLDTFQLTPAYAGDRPRR